MIDSRQINGFSRLSKDEQRRWLTEHFLHPEQAAELTRFDAGDEGLQGVIDNFSENTVANFPMPFGVAPNFVVIGETDAVPMGVEESRVVAAAAAAAK